MYCFDDFVRGTTILFLFFVGFFQCSGVEICFLPIYLFRGLFVVLWGGEGVERVFGGPDVERGIC